MSVTYVGAVVVESSPTVTIPTCTAGDTLVAFVAVYALGSSATCTPPSGWTAVAASTAQRDGLFVFWKTAVTADSGSSATFTVAGGTSVSFIGVGVYGGVQTTPQAATGSGTVAGSSFVTLPSIGAAECVVGFGDFAFTSAQGNVRAEDPDRAFAYLADWLGTPGETSGPGASNVNSTSETWQGATVLLSSAIAPAAPTLTAPANGAYMDTASGLTFTGTYNATDGAYANARAMRVKTSGGTYSYYNAATNALQSTEVWNPVSIAPAASGSFTLPAAAIPDGSTYNWSMADQESGDNLQGAFASDFTFAAQTSPAVVITSPPGTVVTATPDVAWTPTPAPGASVTAWQVRVFSSAQYEASGFDPATSTATWDSGVVAGSASAVMVGTSLTNGGTYRFYVQVTETGSEMSAWTYTAATISLDPPATPVVTAAQGVGPNGLPVVALTVQGTDNLLSADDASFEDSIGTWTGTTNATVAQSAAEALDGSYSLAVTATAAGNAACDTGDYAVTAGQTYSATAAVRAATTGRQATLAVLWLNSSGTLISTTTGTAVTDTTTGWAVATASAAAPAGAVHAQLQVTIASAAASEVHYVDEAGIRPGTDPTWFRGGLAGTVQIVVTRDDGLQLRGASSANPANMPSSQVLALVEAELVPTVGHTWTAVGTVVVSPTVSLSSAASAASNQIALATSGWWQFDPTDLTTAVAAQMADYNPQITEQSTAHIVLGQTNPNVVASAMGGVDGTATFETFDAATYQGLTALLLSQKTVFISDPFGDNAGVTYVRFGPQTGGMSTGTGNKSKDAKLHPSTASAPHHEVSVTWIAQNRPAV